MLRPHLLKHRASIGYVFLVVIAVVTVQWQHSRSEREQDQSDRQVCEALSTVTENQRFILGTLTIVIARQTEITRSPDLVSRLDSLERLGRGLPKFACELGLVRVE